MEKDINKIYKQLAKEGLLLGHTIANRETKDTVTTTRETHFNTTKEQISQAIKELQSNE